MGIYGTLCKLSDGGWYSGNLSDSGVVIQSLISGVINLQVSLLIRRELFERAKDFNIILDDVAITELSFSREYTAAVEAKQVGEEI